MTDCPSTSSGSSYAPGSQLALSLPLPLQFLALSEGSDSETAAARSIRATWTTSRYQVNVTDGIRVRITVETEGVTDKIFAYRLLPRNPTTDERVGQFDHICSPVDLEEYPEDEPIANSVPPWYRLNYVDLLLRSQAETDDFVKSVLEDIESLVYTLGLMLDIAPGTSGSQTFE